MTFRENKAIVKAEVNALDENKLKLIVNRFGKNKKPRDRDGLLKSLPKSCTDEDMVTVLDTMGFKYPYSKKRYKRLSKGTHMQTQPDRFAFYLIDNKPDLIDWRD